VHNLISRQPTKEHTVKLTDINLTDRTEVEAARALLDAILGAGLIAHADRPDVGTVTVAATPTAALAPSAVSIIGHAATPVRIDSTTPPDAAAVFGGTAPAPFVPPTADVAPLPTAPAASLPLPAATLPAPPTAPVVAAPTASAAPTSPVETDADGLPWDERIHAGTKRKNADGRWTAKRGLNDPALVTRVTEQLRQVTAPLPSGPSTVAAVPLPAPGGPLVPAPAGAASPTSFEQLMPLLTSATIAGKIPPTAANEACVAHGLQGVIALQQQPVYVATIWAYLVQQFPALAQ
jgi:hypothetical protein